MATPSKHPGSAPSSPRFAEEETPGLREADAAFEGLRASPSIDHVFRALQHSLVTWSAMADTKASIMITISSIVLTLGATQFDNPVVRPAFLVLMICTLAALLLSVLAVLPSTRFPKDPAGQLDMDSDQFGLLYFGHFAHMPRDRFVRELAAVLKEEDKLYNALARDVFGQGQSLALRKYRLLRWSYVAFVTGFLGAGLVLLLRVLGGSV